MDAAKSKEVGDLSKGVSACQKQAIVSLSAERRMSGVLTIGIIIYLYGRCFAAICAVVRRFYNPVFSV